MKKFIQGWLINTFAVLVAVYVVKGIHYQHNEWPALLAASLLLGIFNVFLRPILMVLSLPLLIFTLGLFRLVINALLLYFVGYLLRPYFYVDSFWDAFWGALIISIISLILGAMIGGDTRLRVQRHRRTDDSGNGPVIDV